VLLKGLEGAFGVVGVAGSWITMSMVAALRRMF
jgi:hypothetical protein